MKKIVLETIDGSIENIIQLKTLDNSLEFSQMFDALEDTPRDFQTKLIDALNSLGETMQIPPTEAFNKVLCRSDDENEDVKKKLYNWWRAFFEVLGKVVGNMPTVKSAEFTEKMDDLMAEIMKAGDAEASTEEDTPVMESTKPRFKKGDFVVVRNGDDARVLRAYRDRVDKSIWYEVWIMDGNRTTEFRDDDVYASRKEYEAKYLYEEEIVSERSLSFAEKYGVKKGDPVEVWLYCMGKGSWARGFTYVCGGSYGEYVWVTDGRGKYEMPVDCVRPIEYVNEEYEQATKEDEDKMLADMDFAVQHLGEIANKVKAIVNFINPYCETTFNEEKNNMKFNKIDERAGGDSDEWVSWDEMVGLADLENELDRGDDGWVEIGHQPVGESKPVELESGATKKVSLYVDWDDDGAGLDSNVVIDVPAEIADSEESDALYDYISDWIDHQDFCVNDWAITDIEGLDKVDEGSEDEIKGGEVKDGEKQVTQDGETKTLVAGEEENKKPVCEMTIEQEIDDPWKLSELLWSQGKENLEELLRSELVGEEDIMQMLEDTGVRNLTNINDLFAFDFLSVLDSLGLDGQAWNRNLEFKRKGEDSED